MTDVVAAALRHHLPAHHARGRRHPATEVAQAVADTALIELGFHDVAEERVQLAQAAILPPAVAEVVPRVEARGDVPGGGDREPFVHQELAQRHVTRAVPAIELPARFVDRAPEIAAASGRAVADRVRHLVGDPEREQRGREAESVRRAVGTAGEVLECYGYGG